MVSLMGIFRADISLLEAEIAEGDKNIVYPDLVYTIKHEGAYRPPLVVPENGHLRVTYFYDFYRACRDAGLTHLLCEVPDGLESRLPQKVERTEIPTKTPLFWFYDTTPGVDNAVKVMSRIQGFNKELGGNAVESYCFDQAAGCVNLKLANSSESEPYLYNSIIGLVLGFEKELGRLRSINGIKPKLS